MELNAARHAAAQLAALCADAHTLDGHALRESGSTVVFAPHPDDESLGCGGLIALRAAQGSDVWPVLVSDGAASHPGSRAFDADARRALRDDEWLAALACLGVDTARATRLGCGDGEVPGVADPRFSDVVARCRTLIEDIEPALVVVPWRRDPHPDHQATHAIVRAALATLPPELPAPRCLEYLVWAGERAQLDDLPRTGEAIAWRLDIAEVVERKRAAIAAHRSQLGEIIDDDPGGFTIAPEMRRRAERPVEYFFESRRGA